MVPSTNSPSPSQPVYLSTHPPQPKMTNQPVKCQATTAKGQPCRAWAVVGSQPSRCASHGGTTRSPGAPPSNTNRETHGAYTAPLEEPVSLPARILDLNRRINRLSHYLDNLELGDGTEQTITVKDYATLAALHGQLTSRLGRLLRDQQHIDEQDGSELDLAIEQALTVAGEKLGITL
jgi:hypothetical protein